MKAMFLILLIVPCVWAVEIKVKKIEAEVDQESGKLITKHYLEGSHLIYDCKEMAWLCVDINGWKSCSENRAKARKRKLKNMPCAPVKKYDKQKMCFQAQQNIVSFIEGSNPCQNYD
ncbi:MAG: hypothetical protein HOE90_17490 [Bacteriovoracaceae bacterium]|nr:hypothetical protein [Bacteriovoracaceae bacterium]